MTLIDDTSYVNRKKKIRAQSQFFRSSARACVTFTLSRHFLLMAFVLSTIRNFDLYRWHALNSETIQRADISEKL